ncbi:MAG: Calx-beta domain-containing protein, partial [Cyclobacteriaceae bacterium]
DDEISIDTNNNEATVTISDDYTATVSITANDATADESGSNNGQFTVTVSSASSTDTDVSYTLSGSATAGDDYTTLTGKVTIPAGSTSEIINVLVTNDAIVESDETVTLTLSSLNGDTDITIDTDNDEATVTISDVDEATVTISANDASANESGSNNGQFTVTLSSASSTDTEVSYTISGSATEGDDYAVLTGKVTIPAGSTEANIDVNVTNDNVLEGDETVTITLSAILGDDEISIDTDNDEATVTISDSDVATVSITANDATADESGSNNGQFTLTLSSVSSTDTEVSYTLSGSATEGSDYTALTGKVTIPAGSTSAIINIEVVNDDVVEGDEITIVTLSAVLGDDEISIDTNNNEATITISDDDTATVSVTANDANADESESNDGQFTVTLSSVSSTDTEVNYTLGGTATAGTDYTTLTGKVTIPAGSASATVNITVLDDARVEADETVILTITSLDGDTEISIDTDNDEATVTISDNDGMATLTVEDITIDENGFNNFTVKLDKAVQGGFEINYSFTDGTALGGTDYDNTAGVITF